MGNTEKLSNDIESNELEQKYGDNAELVKINEFNKDFEKAQKTKYQGRKEIFRSSAGDTMLIDPQEGKKSIADAEAYGEAAQRNLDMKSEAVKRQIEIDNKFAKKSAELDAELQNNKENINSGQKSMEMAINQEIIAAVNAPEEENETNKETETATPILSNSDTESVVSPGDEMLPNEAPLESVVLPSEGESIGPEDSVEYN